MEGLEEALDGAVGVAALQGGTVVCVDFEAGLSAESDEKDHGSAGLLGTAAQRSKVVDVGGSVKVQSGRETVDDGVVSDAPKARGGGAAHADPSRDSARRRGAVSRVVGG